MSNGSETAAVDSLNPHLDLDVLVVGAGFGGMYAVQHYRELGFRVHGIEAGSDVGGVWFWNRYPGARCDIESVEYSYSFDPQLEQDWTWSQRYPTQPEMLHYADHVAERYDLRPDFTFNTRVISAHLDEAAGRWRVTTDTGLVVSAQFCVMATGVLSAARTPEFLGLDRYAGKIYHTANWPTEPVDLTGQRVGVIGTGSSGIQVIPNLAAQAEHLTVFQRTPNFSIAVDNPALDEETVRAVKATYPARRDHARRSFGGSTIPINKVSVLAVSEEERTRNFESRWGLGGFNFLASYMDISTNEEANRIAADFVRGKIRSIVHDPEVAERLSPRDHPIGSKRICVDSGYFETYNRPNVSLVDIRENPIEEFTESGITAGGEHYELDAVVLATGFDAMTGALMRIDIRGRDGVRLHDAWADGPHSYLGLMVTGFPNLFTITGPGSPAVLSNMILSIEQHVDWIGDCLTYLREHRLQGIEPELQAQTDWVAHVAAVADQTLYPKANSWYMGSNVPGKPRVFLPYTGGVGSYRKKCNAVAANDYEGFALLKDLSPATTPA